jgi:hypothetical protein
MRSSIAARLLLALALAGVVGAIAAPARADDDWRRHERIEHERIEREREWRAHHRRPVHVAPAPAYVYAPPPVVYAPPPPAAGINLIFPLTIR